MKSRFKRPLNDRHDKLVFGSVFLFGICGIIGIRVLGDIYYRSGLNFIDFLAIAWALLIISVYCIYIIGSKDRSSISIDRASDNVYYIGLLFTLTSLAYSLVKLSLYSTDTTQVSATASMSSGNQVISLLPDFGLALASTIAGIFGRILLQQMRADPLDIETEAREELGRSVKELRFTIGEVVAELNALSAQTRVSLTELGQNVSKTLTETAKNSSEAFETLSLGIQNVSSKLEDQALSIGEQSNETSEMMTQMLATMDKSLTAIGALPVSITEKFDAAADRIRELTGNVSETLESQRVLASSLADTTGVIKALFSENSWHDFSANLNHVKSELAVLAEETTNLSKAISASVESHHAQLQKLSDTSQSSSGAYETLATTILGISEKLEKQAQDIGEQTQETSATMAEILSAMRSSMNIIGELPISITEKFDAAAARIHEVSAHISDTVSAQRSLALSISDTGSSLKSVFSENSWDGFSNHIDSTKAQLSLLTAEITRLSQTISNSADAYDSQIKRLSEAGGEFGNAEKLMNETTGLLTSASNKYIDALSNAAQQLRDSTDKLR